MRGCPVLARKRTGGPCGCTDGAAPGRKQRFLWRGASFDAWKGTGEKRFYQFFLVITSYRNIAEKEQTEYSGEAWKRREKTGGRGTQIMGTDRCFFGVCALFAAEKPKCRDMSGS